MLLIHKLRYEVVTDQWCKICITNSRILSLRYVYIFFFLLLFFNGRLLTFKWFLFLISVVVVTFFNFLLTFFIFLFFAIWRSLRYFLLEQSQLFHLPLLSNLSSPSVGLDPGNALTLFPLFFLLLLLFKLSQHFVIIIGVHMVISSRFLGILAFFHITMVSLVIVIASL